MKRRCKVTYKTSVWRVEGSEGRVGVPRPCLYLRSALGRHLPDGPAKPRAPQAVGGPPPLLLASLHLAALRLDGPKADPGIFAQQFNPEGLGQGHLGQFAAGGGRALRFVGLDAKGVGGGVVPVEGEGWTA